ncbi:MAG: TetR/AcrR family transcriptional regulator, partial [Pseudomonadota bacterium]
MAKPIKTSAEQWVRCAKLALMNEGISGVKIDRLAKSLDVTRGGFYHHFQNRAQLLDELLKLWSAENIFVPHVPPPYTAPEAHHYLDRLIEYLIDEEMFSPDFDLAVRAWARTDARAKLAVDEVDARRLSALTKIFAALDYSNEEATTRARVFYFHQIGSYVMGHHHIQSKPQRHKEAHMYLHILGGDQLSASLKER